MANEAKIIITADPSGAIAGIKQVEIATSDLASRTGGIVTQLQSHWLAISAAVVGASYTFQQAWGLAERAAMFEEQMASLNALASQYDMTARQIVDSVVEASNRLISMSNAASVSAKALMMGLNPEQLISFMKIVETTTNVTGDSVAQAFEKITEAAAAGRERTLKQMGIMVDLDAAYRKYAESVGKTTNELSEHEKRLAGIIAIQAKGTEIMNRLGESTDSHADKMERLRITIENLELQAGAFIKRLGFAFFGILNAIGLAVTKTVEMIIAPVALLEKGLNKGLNKIGIVGTFWQDTFTKIQGASSKLAQNTEDNFSAMVASAEDLQKAKATLSGFGEEAEKTKEKISKLAEEFSKIKRKLEIELALVGLEDFDRKMKELEFQLIEWREKFGKEKAQILFELSVQIIDREKAIKQAEEAKKLKEQLEREEREFQKRRLEVTAWVTDKINQLTLSEVEYKKLKLEDEYQKRAEIIGWTLELQRAYQEELSAIDRDESEKRLKELQAILEKEEAIYREHHERIWALMANTTNLIGGEQGRWLGLFSAGIQNMLTYNEEFYAEQLMQLQESLFEKLDALTSAKATETEIIDAYNQYQLQQEAVLQQQKIMMYANAVNMIFGILGTLASFSDKNNKAMFYIQKAFALASAVINTALAITKAMALGPPGWAMIPWIKALGAIQIATIAAQTLMGPPKTAGAAGGRAGASAGTSISPVISAQQTGAEKEEKSSQVVNIYVYGHVVDHDSFAREIIPSIQKAVSDGVR